MSSSQPDPTGSSFNPDEMTFEEAFRQLAEIAEKMETGGQTLGDATAQFEQGMKLVQRCNQLLDSAELEVTTLRENYQRPAASPSAPVDSELPYFDDGSYDGVPDEEEEIPF